MVVPNGVLGGMLAVCPAGHWWSAQQCVGGALVVFPVECCPRWARASAVFSNNQVWVSKQSYN